jgi:hypothetical protein
MSISEDLIKKIRQKKFEPLTTSQFRYKTNDVVIQTDEEGNAVRMFIGKLSEEGMIRGDRYSRVLKKDKNGKIIKDHWDRKGRAS